MTRYPEPGKVKTRLLPALGATGAARLHRQMVEHTMSTIRGVAANSPVKIFLFFQGGSEALMALWLGNEVEYLPQAGGDLGDKMRGAFEVVFKRGFASAVIIGTDCPALDHQILSRAFCELEEAGMVIGPALDGGYYLLGLKQVHDRLFTGISWGGSEVLKQTLAAACAEYLTVKQLPELSDIDRPEDLENLKKMAAFSAWHNVSD
ncbi:MAG: TIGR04282 family arsenosugar biosynthesis glycosyltransferase [Deltaproteobacteria bacterium]|nr:TIGR04282 family arsenosugar biosynthesis glycosyltransferase [Candidatus Tharpella sp.]